MYEGLYWGALLICIACGVIDLMSGDFARAATAGTILFIMACFGIRSMIHESRFTKQRIEALKKWYPDETEDWYRNRIRLNFDGGDIQYAAKQKKIEKLKELVPGQQDWWYKVHVDDEQYKGRL